jgi:hypothetical protein
VPEPTNRRGLLRALMKSAGEALGEYTDAVNAGTAPFEKAAAEQAAAEAAAAAAPPPPLTQMAHVARTLTAAELDDMVAEERLEHRRDALRGLARPATRLTPSLGSSPQRSWIGRPEDAAPADGTATPVADIDLADPALAGGSLSGTGRLVVLIAAPRQGPAPPCSRAQVRVELDPDAERPRGRSVHLSTELTLPRVWSAPVQALGLDDAEHAAYVRLRQRLAEVQGVTAEDGAAEGVARHHLLGYPTETTGTMAVACVLAARGLDPDAPPSDIPDDAVAAAEGWRLLLQLTDDRGSGVTLGTGTDRLYVWIEHERLERRDFSEVWAIAR